MQAGFYGQMGSSSQQNVTLRSIPTNHSIGLIGDTAGSDAYNRGFSEVLKVVGSLRQELKELKDPLKLLQSNVNNIQSDLTLLKETVELKAGSSTQNDYKTKSSRLPKVLTVC